ncbi:MAG TPA: ATP-binding protein [Vicinamibacterales bacterium]|nr:ATP-binding protein [Vicinamibacterales bacterium]
MRTLRQPLLVLDADLRVVTGNPAFYSAFQLDATESAGKTVDTLGAGEWGVMHIADLLKNVIRDDRELTAVEVRPVFGDMHLRRFLLNARALQGLDGAPPMLLLAFEDVTEQRRLALALDATVVELERRNRELQNFASIASHDLQEPLRKIQAFSDRLVTVCGDTLPADARDFVERITRAASRMSTLINDLLNLTKIMTRGKPFQPTSLTDVATAVLNDLEDAVTRSGASVTLDGLPVVNADPTQMRQLLQNLIGNALKFRDTTHPLVVAVSGSPLADGWRLTVEDNGIGFASEYAERIFDPFERLHARSEYEGTGIGLALCRRIMERHGGTIFASSDGAGGARFDVTFPNSSRMP